ncbi:TetR/AcrR family transcriptional regulator [Deinococcus roseus]|uniref:HTH tetR-type domain-containing protein n=1 Tax=Deinococcus roseus TaxID=392414 RepID=A0ABQ2D2N2_9DEIO|nr:TetR/AcrR family transcriptional regulator [Deinococcus roseus]GGJ40961.1 hypothetical protein GCM10008938_28760 [Deinococcus roseus]
MPDPTDPIQQQLIEARKKQILKAAAQVFAEKGFHSATIKQIARTAGIADGTIYNYFPNKEALLMGLMNQLNETPERPIHFQEGQTLDFEAFLTVYLEHRMGQIQQDMTILQGLLPELLVNRDLQARYQHEIMAPTFQIAEQYFGQLIKEGKLKALPVELTVRILAASALGVAVLNLLGDKVIQDQWQEAGKVLSQVLLGGLKEEKHG